MKNSDEKDPLNEKKKEERKKEPNSPETFKEEKDNGTEEQVDPAASETGTSPRESSVEADGTLQSEQETSIRIRNHQKNPRNQNLPGRLQKRSLPNRNPNRNHLKNPRNQNLPGPLQRRGPGMKSWFRHHSKPVPNI